MAEQTTGQKQAETTHKQTSHTVCGSGEVKQGWSGRDHMGAIPIYPRAAVSWHSNTGVHCSGPLLSLQGLSVCPSVLSGAGGSRQTRTSWWEMCWASPPLPREVAKWPRDIKGCFSQQPRCVLEGYRHMAEQKGYMHITYDFKINFLLSEDAKVSIRSYPHPTWKVLVKI